MILMMMCYAWFLALRFRAYCFRDPCQHYRSVAPLPFPCRVRITD